MNKILKNISLVMGVGCMLFAMPSCSDSDDMLESVEYDRLFAPVGLEFRVNQVNVTVNWTCLSEADSVSYAMEVYNDGGQLTFEGTPVGQYTTSARTYLIEGLDGATTYSFRIKAVGQVKESNWATGTFETGTEQIMSSVAAEDIGGTYVTLRWPAGEEAARIVLTPTTNTDAGTVEYNITAEDIANGYAYIEGLTPETEYSAVMYRDNGAIRGSRTFTTTIDTGNMTVLRGGTAEDLIAAIEADNGEGIFLMEAGEYALGSYQLTKSITIAGNPAALSTIHVQFQIASTVQSLTLSNVILDGASMEEGGEASANVVTMTDAAGVLTTLNINGCEITGYRNNFLYANGMGTFGDIIINNCYIHDSFASGGDGFDFRGGSNVGSVNVANTTFANGFRTFFRCQAALTGNVTFDHCTFYNVCINNNSNNNGLWRITDGANSVFTVTNSIFYGIGFEGASGNMGVWARTGSNLVVNREVYENNYWYASPNLWGGRYDASTSSTVATEADPNFVDAENGNLTPQNEDIVYYRAGDPRWLQ